MYDYGLGTAVNGIQFSDNGVWLPQHMGCYILNTMYGYGLWASAFGVLYFEYDVRASVEVFALGLSDT